MGIGHKERFNVLLKITVCVCVVYIYSSVISYLFSDLILPTMFLLRSRLFVERFFRAAGPMVEVGPRVSAVKLIHTIQTFNNGEISYF